MLIWTKIVSYVGGIIKVFMFKLTRLSDYAVLILSCFQKKALLSAKQVADHTHLPLPTIRKVLRLLGQAKLVEAQMGAQGGYALCRPANQISILEVVQAMEGVKAMTPCLDQQHCSSQVSCQLHVSWQTIHFWLNEMMRQVSLQDMVDGCHHHALQQLFTPFVKARLKAS